MTEAPVVHVFLRQFAGVPESLRAVRRFVVTSATAAGVPASLLDDLVLVADELASNVIAHTDSGRSGGTYSVRLDVAAGQEVTVHVRDSGGTRLLRAPGYGTGIPEGGRGLEIVRSLARHYGTGAADLCSCEGTPYLHCSWAAFTYP